MPKLVTKPCIFCQKTLTLKPLKLKSLKFIKGWILLLPVFCQTVFANPSATTMPIFATTPIATTTPIVAEIPNEAKVPNEADDGGEVEIADDLGFVPDLSEVDVDKLAQIAEENPDIGQAANIPLGAIAPSTIAKFVKMIDVVRQDYVETVDDEQLFVNAMNGVLTRLDPYSEYLDAKAFENLRLFTEGDVGSIGVQVSYHPDEKMWVFDDVLANSPADQAGIQPGYYLHQINDNKLNDEQTQQDIEQVLSGIAGTSLKLTISDKGRRKHSVNVQRNLVEQQSVQARMDQGVVIVQIPVFQNNTLQQVMRAIAGLEEPFNAVILDVRNNPGGVLSSANDVASLFMNNKMLVQIKNRNGLQETMKTYHNARLANVPLAVIQNRYSASAAEVLASALQENQRAKIYGETSYGKGSIQSIIPVNDNEAVKLTVAHYYSGKGRQIDGVGVKADVELKNGEKMWENQVLQQMLQTSRPTFYQLHNTPNVQEF
ncbi:C-terminal processing peptidase [Moraxella macacae 0408225]|uniref:C-terminal processing peptidase n=1 Tax=Moraxella macacae 0408225 TaxID=1230338 RepID=L2F615_9GAMM|nr:S41 family peptidase [Moraxella macacae]ELA08345.1 C-terminal processing peptidase [Moraxella macacae 0408225]